MSLTRLISRFFSREVASGDNDFTLSRLGESRPTGHFREFTVPRSRQRGGAARVGGGGGRGRDAGGIIPCTGGNIP